MLLIYAIFSDMLREFQSWWVKQIMGLAPKRLQQLAIFTVDALVIDLQPSSLALSMRRHGSFVFLSRFERDSHGMSALRQAIDRLRGRKLGIVLRIASEQALRKIVTLPLAARVNLKQALIFEMSRETPFENGEILWDYAVLHQDRATERIAVELMLVPKTLVADVLDIIRSVGASVEAIEVERPGRTYRMTLDGSTTSGAGFRRRSIAALAAVTVVLALVAIILPIVRQQRQLATLDSAIETVETQIKAVVGMKKEIEQLSKAANFLVEEHARVANPIGTLASVTQAIPDDSYLTEFVLRNNRLTIVGYSPSAADLIGRLAAIKLLRDPSFTAPVTRPGGSKLELFTISASIAADGGGS